MSAREGVVITSTGNHCVVRTREGELHRCQLRGRRGTRPVCGDWVSWQALEQGGVIEAIQTRRNVLERGDFRGHPHALAANIDRLLLVIAPSPSPDPLLMDRYAVLAHALELPLSIWVNKIDTSQRSAALTQTTAPYTRFGVKTLHGSALTGAGIDSLEALTANETVILAGQSGVGKSSLTQRLIPHLELRVGEISTISGQGRHTTSTTTWFARPQGGALIDSPGVRTLRLDHLSAKAVLQGFPEIAAAAPQCRFRDCQHRQEPDCAVKHAIATGDITSQRLENWRLLSAEATQTTATSR